MFSYKSIFAFLVVIPMATALPMGNCSGSEYTLLIFEFQPIPGIPDFQLVYELVEKLPGGPPGARDLAEIFTVTPDV